jgi:hypothetical protein
MDQPVDLSGGDRVAISLAPPNRAREGPAAPVSEEGVSGILRPSSPNIDGATAHLGQLQVSLLEVRHGLELKGQGVMITPRMGYHFEVVILAIQNVSSYENCTRLDASLGLPEEGAELNYNFDSASPNAPPGSKLQISYIFLVHHTVKPKVFTLTLARYSDTLLVRGAVPGCPVLSDVVSAGATASFHLESYEHGIENTLDGASIPGNTAPE